MIYFDKGRFTSTLETETIHSKFPENSLIDSDNPDCYWMNRKKAEK